MPAEPAEPAEPNGPKPPRGAAARAGRVRAAAARGSGGDPSGTHSTWVGADVSAAAVEFGRAVETYKRARNRPFPTCTEILGILHGLGYRKVEPPRPAPGPDGRGAAGEAPAAAPGGRGNLPPITRGVA